MKKIEAIINPSKLMKVRDALVESGHGAMTISEVKGSGRQVQKPEMYRGIEYTVGFIPKVKVEVIVRDDEADEMVSLVCRVARSGKVGDGKVLVDAHRRRRPAPNGRARREGSLTMLKH